jgi:hypothetical protein
MYSNDSMIMNNEVECIWKEAVAAYFELLSWNLFGEI